MNLLFLSPSGGEIIILLIAVLLLFGSDKIPGLARGLGKGIREIKNATSDIQNEITKDKNSPIKDFQKIKEDLNDVKNKL
tara:strand:- start:263 stop:502 length:240 start_codon:yes stop_codon:yes gene_type:complete